MGMHFVCHFIITRTCAHVRLSPSLLAWPGTGSRQAGLRTLTDDKRDKRWEDIYDELLYLPFLALTQNVCRFCLPSVRVHLVHHNARHRGRPSRAAPAANDPVALTVKVREQREVTLPQTTLAWHSFA